MPKTEPTTLIDAIRMFADPDVALEYLVALRWPNGVTCPTCGLLEPSYLANVRRWQCRAKHPKRQFTVKVGTIMEDSPIALDKWLAAIWLLANDKNGISSYELARGIGVTQKSAWFMLQRIRLAMEDGTFNKMRGEVEADETYIGGKARNMHKIARSRRSAPRSRPASAVRPQSWASSSGRAERSLDRSRQTDHVRYSCGTRRQRARERRAGIVPVH